LLAVFGTGLAAAAARPHSPSYVFAHERALNGRWITVQGRINECYHLTCLICDEPETPRASEDCITVDFAVTPKWAEGEDDQDDSPIDSYRIHSRAKRVLEEYVRFASVAVKARVTAVCRKELIICGDRGEDLLDARILSMPVRRRAAEGLFTRYEGRPLRVITDADAEAISAALPEHYQHDDSTPVEERKVFRITGSPEQAEDPAAATICVCNQESCDGLWPTRRGHLIPSPGNPYDCFGAQKVGGAGRINPWT
jgi:hypothetical protein